MAVKTETKKPAFIEREIILKGLVKFSNLKEAEGFQQSEENKKYSITLALKPDDPQLKMLQGLHEKAIAAVAAEAREEGKKIPKPTELSIGEDYTKDKETGELIPTCLVTVRFNRSEKIGPPTVVDRNLNELDRNRIPSGSLVNVQMTAMSYNVAGRVGLTLKLDHVQILHEVEMQAKAPSFHVVDIDDSPFAD